MCVCVSALLPITIPSKVSSNPTAEDLEPT